MLHVLCNDSELIEIIIFFLEVGLGISKGASSCKCWNQQWVRKTKRCFQASVSADFKDTEMLKSVCNSFKQGWLFDEVINSYFWCLEKSNPAILYAPSTSMMVMQKGVPCGQLWKDVNIFLKKFIIAPWNPTDYH